MVAEDCHWKHFQRLKFLISKYFFTFCFYISFSIFVYRRVFVVTIEIVGLECWIDHVI